MPNEQYRIFMESYVRFMEEMAEGESKKYAAMLSYDPKRIDHAVSRQQAMNMRLGQMEEQRELEQKRAGLEGLTFQQILARLEPEEREVFTALFRRFERAIGDIKYFNGKSIAFAQEGLQMLGTAENSQAGTYSANGKRPDSGNGTSLFEAKV